MFWFWYATAGQAKHHFFLNFHSAKHHNVTKIALKCYNITKANQGNSRNSCNSFTKQTKTINILWRSVSMSLGAQSILIQSNSRLMLDLTETCYIGIIVLISDQCSFDIQSSQSSPNITLPSPSNPDLIYIGKSACAGNWSEWFWNKSFYEISSFLWIECH